MANTNGRISDPYHQKIGQGLFGHSAISSRHRQHSAMIHPSCQNEHPALSGLVLLAKASLSHTNEQLPTAQFDVPPGPPIDRGPRIDVQVHPVMVFVDVACMQHRPTPRRPFLSPLPSWGGSLSLSLSGPKTLQHTSRPLVQAPASLRFKNSLLALHSSSLPALRAQFLQCFVTACRIPASEA